MIRALRSLSYLVRAISLDVSQQPWAKRILDKIKMLPVPLVFDKFKFQLIGNAKDQEACCARTKGKSTNVDYSGGLGLEISTQDSGLPGYSLTIPNLLEIGLFTRIKLFGAGTLVTTKDRCLDKYNNTGASLNGSGSVEATLKAEFTGIVKLTGVNAGGALGISCKERSEETIGCSVGGYIFAKSEIEVANFKYSALDFYRSTGVGDFDTPVAGIGLN
jgi:hypothetical protein